MSGISLDVKEGETLGLVGESGCGKSTTGRALMQFPSPTGGKVTFEGEELTALAGEDLRNIRTRMQMIFQDPISSLNPRRKVGDIVGEPLAIWAKPAREERGVLTTVAAGLSMLIAGIFAVVGLVWGLMGLALLTGAFENELTFGPITLENSFLGLFVGLRRRRRGRGLPVGRPRAAAPGRRRQGPDGQRRRGRGPPRAGGLDRARVPPLLLVPGPRGRPPGRGRVCSTTRAVTRTSPASARRASG